MPNPETVDSVVSLRGVAKVYSSGHSTVPALESAELEVRRGEFAAITGPSGCGKSTMLQILGCLDRPTSGSYLLEGRDVSTMTNDELAAMRLNHIGFVFQSFHLLPRLPVVDNVELPLVYANVRGARRRELAAAALRRVGMAHRMDHNPLQLSGGERQRVAIARALVNDPALILADEPTGNLDSNRGAEILALFHELHRSGKTILMVTHDASIAASTQRIIRLKDGRIVEDIALTRPSPAGAGDSRGGGVLSPA
ncbi:MAG: ABC transporter ATP-binding protein [Elusimicrobia bacterium]|nr:ABC transporter ATP-binding protein [Elusimicrobiota bacterium]